LKGLACFRRMHAAAASIAQLDAAGSQAMMSVITLPETSVSRKSRPLKR
jgi:hypothetical protein